MNNIDIIRKKIEITGRLRDYLLHARSSALSRGVIGRGARDLSMDEGDVLAAFRMRFAEYQEQIGKLLGAIAREEDIAIKGASSLAAFAEKFGFISEDDWKRIRDIRNNIHHDYEEDMVAELSQAMSNETDMLAGMLDPVISYCKNTYQITFDPTDERESGKKNEWRPK